MAQHRSRSFLLVQERLDADLTDTVRQLRSEGASWHTISLRLHEQTGVAVTPETVRLWFVQVVGMERGRAGDAA